ncbi:MAG: hypothetical protein LKF98_01600 [Microbacteriaceae bacterium]|jgi:peptidoglycan hydrolase-like protein with peptidoglycan-binding domain|nr:hypothetical protein [Microbacteriaceae bacterium]
MKGKHAKPKIITLSKMSVMVLAGVIATVGVGVGSSVASPTVTKAQAAYGPDTSSNNGWIDYGTIQGSGASFAFVKATQGTGYVNPYYAGATQQLRDRGMAVGHYHFLTRTVSGAAQANYFVNHLQHYRTGDPLAGDYEGTYKNESVMLAFFRQLRARVPNGNLFIYGGRVADLGTISSYGWTVLRSLNVRVWVASWGSVRPTTVGGLAAPIWQYTDAHYVNGKRLDWNYADASAWTGTTTPSSATTSTGTVTNTYHVTTINGYSVRTVQTLLLKRGFSVGSSGVDGIFGNDTKAGALAFQKWVNSQLGYTALTEDGIPGRWTMAFLNKVYQDGWAGSITINRAEALAGVTPDGKITGQRYSTRGYAWHVLAHGYSARAVGSATVRAMQRKLAALGYYHGRIDGLWEGGTSLAMEQYYRHLGIYHGSLDSVAGTQLIKAWQSRLEANHLV